MDVLHSLDPAQTTGIVIVTVVSIAVSLISITGIVMGVWMCILAKRSDAMLKGEMIARGMSADEIIRVVHAESGGAQSMASSVASAMAHNRATVAGLPLASEAVVNRDGEWHPALVLQSAEGGYLVHFVGESMAENDWVSSDHIRFAAGSPHVQNGYPSRNGMPRKGPIEQEV